MAVKGHLLLAVLATSGQGKWASAATIHPAYPANPALVSAQLSVSGRCLKGSSADQLF